MVLTTMVLRMTVLIMMVLMTMVLTTMVRRMTVLPMMVLTIPIIQSVFNFSSEQYSALTAYLTCAAQDILDRKVVSDF